ncbi:MAG: hypothetical protein M1834_009238 [Cirrosporium novae-zelandiae]|nr:MAG: hypothetical protein M1834_009238 [Cirrosporium novae-zelandiae]
MRAFLRPLVSSTRTIFPRGRIIIPRTHLTNSNNTLTFRRTANTVPNTYFPAPQPLFRIGLLFRRLLYIAIFTGLGYRYGSKSVPDVEGKSGDRGAYKIAKKLGLVDEGETLTDWVVRELSSNKAISLLREQEGWLEWEAYSGLEEEEKKHLYTAGPLGGEDGLVMQRIFYNPRDEVLLAIVSIGPKLVGWPGFIHGGALATLLDEMMSRLATRTLPPPHKSVMTAFLNVNYYAPVAPSKTYIIEAVLAPSDGPLTTESFRKHEQSGSTGSAQVSERKRWVVGTMNDGKGDMVCSAQGLFVVPKQLELDTPKGGF